MARACEPVCSGSPWVAVLRRGGPNESGWHRLAPSCMHVLWVVMLTLLWWDLAV